MEKEVSFIIRLDDKGTFKKVTVNSEELGRAIRKVEDEAEKAKRTVLTWSEASQAVDVLQNAIGELQNAISDLTSAYQVQLVAETQLNTIMRQRMAASDDEIQSIKDLCSAQQQLGVVGDEVQLSGAQQMATFLQNKQSLDVLIPAMNNLIAQQEGLNASTNGAVSIGNMMGKAMQGQVDVLQRVGITFTEAQKKVLQYGTESERAAMLAQVITDNVGNMNAELAKTDAGKQKQLENNLGDIKEQLGGLVQGIAPTITMLSQLVITGAGVAKLTTSLYASAQAMRTLILSTELLTRAKVAAVAIVRVMTSACQGEAVGATTAAVATRALSAAVKGLLISTGVGVAIWLLVEAIGQLASSSDDAADKMDDLSDAEQRAKQAHQQTAQEIASVRSEMDLNILKLKDFKGSKKDEKKLVDEMNTKYGEAMGYYSTVAQWYTALTKNSKMYCDQMINEITLRKLANEAADLRQQQHDIWKDENGKTRTYSAQREKEKITHVSGSDPNAPDVTVEWKEKVGSSELEQAQAKYNEARRKERIIRKRMQAIVNKSTSYVHTEGYRATPPPSTGGRVGSGRTGNHTPSVTDPKDNPLKGSIDWYTKAIDEKKKQLAATANEATAKSLNSEMEALQRDLYFLKVRIGVEVPPPIEVKKAIKPMAEQLQESFDDMQKYLKEHPLQVQADPKRLEKLTRKMKDFEKIKGLGNIDLGNFESVKNSITDIRGIVDPTAKGFAAAGTACQAMGSAMQQLGSDSAAAKAGLVMAAIGQLALSLATAMTDAAKQSWITWLAFGISGTAQLVSMVATISQFATGGIVGGNQKSGDRVLARVNSGEMILNAAQQAQLFAIANGRMQPTVNTDVLAGLMTGGAGGARAGSVVGKIRGRDIVLVTANETRSNRRRSNIKI